MRSDSPYRREMQLCDWTFVLGVPDTERGFRRARAYAEYCVGYRDWPDYQERFLKLLKNYVDPLEQAGLKVVRYASVEQFGRQLTGACGVLLFSHCNRDRRLIEFSNGMTSFDDIAAAIDPRFHGIADVSVCSADGINEVIQERAPHCAVRTTKRRVYPTRWLAFHAFVLTEFCTRRCSYAQALLAGTQLFAPKISAQNS